eukprot:TRINITY_DN11834_c0_g1_i1.p1 TRINITY_DN11834_c0_g1~~TRINITY_DN11834_c0_g1_i1.p1  ORF type:complete len:676 (+),score=164.80 TRINITY_DN11834_c0_g1_i1:2295-4322(+)
MASTMPDLDSMLKELDEVENLLATKFEPTHTIDSLTQMKEREALIAKLDTLEAQVDEDFNEDRDAVEAFLDSLGETSDGDVILEDAPLPKPSKPKTEEEIRAARWLNRNLRRLLSVIRGCGDEDEHGRAIISMAALRRDDIAHGFENLEGIVETAVAQGLLREAFDEDEHPFFVVIGKPPADTATINPRLLRMSTRRKRRTSSKPVLNLDKGKVELPAPPTSQSRASFTTRTSGTLPAPSSFRSRAASSMRARSATMTLESTLRNVPASTLQQYSSLVWGQPVGLATPDGTVKAGDTIKASDSPAKGTIKSMLGTSTRRRKTAHELLEEEFRKRPELKVDWTRFSRPELQNFLRVLEAEEQLHVDQVTNLYRAKHIKLQRQIDLLLEQQAEADAQQAQERLSAADVERRNSDAGSANASRIRLRASQDLSTGSDTFNRASSVQERHSASLDDWTSVGDVSKLEGRQRSVTTDPAPVLRRRSQVISVRRKRKQIKSIIAGNGVDPRQAVDLMLEQVDDTPSHASHAGAGQPRRGHRSLYVDDVLDPLELEAAVGVNPELLKLAASWMDSELESIIQVIKSRGAVNAQGHYTITLNDLRQTGVANLVESFAGCLHLGKERGVFAYDAEVIDRSTPATMLIILVKDKLPTQPYRVSDLKTSTRRRRRYSPKPDIVSVV